MQFGMFSNRMVPPDGYLVRRQVKPYPSAEGNSFYLTKGANSDREVLDPAAIARGSSFMNNEWCNGRLGHAISFLAGNVEEAALTMQYLPKEDNLQKDDRDNFAKVLDEIFMKAFRIFLFLVTKTIATKHNITLET